MKARKFSKKHKSSWRKHIDDADVDSFFEDKRLTERLGFVVVTISVLICKMNVSLNHIIRYILLTENRLNSEMTLNYSQ